MINIELIRSAIAKVRSDKNAYLFKNLVPIVPTWGQFIEHLDEAVHQYPTSHSNNPLQERIINGVNQRGIFYLMVDNPNKRIYPESQEVYNIFNEALAAEISPVSAFINFVGKEQPGGAHIDHRETIYWQCIGSAKWQLFHSITDRDPYTEYVLEPGDVIYVAEGVVHRIVAEIPRAAIGFQYRLNDSRFNPGGSV